MTAIGRPVLGRAALAGDRDRRSASCHRLRHRLRGGARHRSHPPSPARRRRGGEPRCDPPAGDAAVAIRGAISIRSISPPTSSSFATRTASIRGSSRRITGRATAPARSACGCCCSTSAARPLAEWRETVAPGAASIVLDSREIRRRFALPEFTGQLFLQVIGAVGHDVVKYALDIFGDDARTCFSCTHDANSWPADFYAGLPAPDSGRAGDALAAEQPALRHTAGRDRAQPHGRRTRPEHRARDRSLRDPRPRPRPGAARGALAAADRDARRQIHGAAALRGGARGQAPHRACQCRAHRPRARSAHSRARQPAGQGLSAAGAGAAARHLALAGAADADGDDAAGSAGRHHRL